MSSFPRHRKARGPSQTLQTSWSCVKCLCPGCSRCPTTATCSGPWRPPLPHTLTHCRRWRWRPTPVLSLWVWALAGQWDWTGRGGWARVGNGTAWQGGMEERWGPRPQATPFRCIPAPGPVTSAHSPPLEPRASFQVPSAASSPARVSDPLHALSPRSLSLSRILCRQVRGTLIPHFGAPQGPSSPFGVVSKAAAPEDVCCVYPWSFPSPLGESSARWLSITRPAVVAEPLMGLRVPFFGRSLRPPWWLMCLYHPAWSIASACPSPQFPLPGTR